MSRDTLRHIPLVRASLVVALHRGNNLCGRPFPRLFQTRAGRDPLPGDHAGLPFLGNHKGRPYRGVNAHVDLGNHEGCPYPGAMPMWPWRAGLAAWASAPLNAL